MPQTLADNSAIRWSSGVINSLQITFNRYKSPEWAIKRRKTPFGYNPFHLNISP